MTYEKITQQMGVFWPCYSHDPQTGEAKYAIVQAEDELASIGMVVGAIAVTIAKSIGRPKAEAVPEDAVDMAHAHNAAPVTQPARA